ncbi:MAG: glucose-6-phosphate dehydrogenase [Amylibacter sp.]
MVSKTIPVQPFDLVVFGATGDLAKRKIIPALFRRFIAGQIPDVSRILGISRQELSNKEYNVMVVDFIKEFVPANVYDQNDVVKFCKMITFLSVDLKSDKGWKELEKFFASNSNQIRTFYLSISPSLIDSCSKKLNDYALITANTRVVVEKPLGTDLPSAKMLNDTLRRVFNEKQIFRIDHYLGKETVQNLMALRFANVLLEPLWNNNYIDHVQITVAETGDVNGRGEYYEDVGAMRDMVQNHLMQLLCLIAMEPPAHFDADDIRNEKLKVIRAIQPVDVKDTVRGQYVDGDNSFKSHVNNINSKTESFVALKAHISNWRWAGVPFYMRTGKGMSKKVSEIVIEFKPLAHSIFPDLGENYQNKLVIRLQPEEGMTLHIGVKEPGPGGMRLINAPLDMTFAQLSGQVEAIEAYERLIMDTCRGDQTLFMRGDELEAAWSWIDNIMSDWNKSNNVPIDYNIGTNGPAEAAELLTRDGRSWQ